MISTVALVLISISNYFLNKQFYAQSYTIYDVVLGNLGLLILCYWLAGLINYKKNKLLFVLLFSFLYALFFVALSEFLIYKYSGVAFVEQSFLHFELQALIVGFTINPFQYIVVVLAIAVFSVLFIKKIPPKQPSKTAASFLLSASLIVLFFAYGTSIGRLVINYNEYLSSQNLIKLKSQDILPYRSFGIQPVKSNDFLQVENPAIKKNLIIIYLESFSRFFVNNEKYPEITPEIKKIIDENGEFDNYHSTAKFTMQGLISSLCGLAPKLTAGNNIGEDLLPYANLPCLSDILHESGYHQEFIGGARKNFSNKEAFLKAKQFDRVWGWTDYNKPSNYQTNDWGLQDSDLFDFAVERIIHLSQLKKPFHVSVLTLATHLDGNPDPNCPKYKPEQNHHKFIDGIHCTDYLLGRFLNQLKQNHLLENTTVLITSDHGVFPVDLIKNLFGKNFQRNRLLGVLLDNYQFNKSLPIALYDIPSILLDSLKIKTNTGFINGRSPSALSMDRFILRESVLTSFEPSIKRECNLEELIERPIDPCENQRLLQINWGYAASFNSNDEKMKIDEVRLTSHQDQPEKLLEIFINGKAQTDKFLIEGYPLSIHERLRNSHLYVLVYDLKTKKILSRNTLRLNKTHLNNLGKYLNKDQKDVYTFIFVENTGLIEEVDSWRQKIIAFGGNDFLKNHRFYFGVYHNNGVGMKVKEWSFDKVENTDITIFDMP